jgi:DMSO/TMAO reductase YedYZ heme-binding membrane subunit
LLPGETLPIARFVPTGDAVSEQMWWYATRAAGLMTWLTATAAVIVGLALSLRIVRSRTGPWVLDLHRYLGGLSTVFLIAHVGTLYADSYVEFGPRELFIPGEATWETEAMAWGIIAAWILIAVEITSLLRPHFGKTVWRAIHSLSVVTVAAGGYHAWAAGSDVHNPITWTIAGAGTVMVLGLIALRLQRRQEEADPGGLSLDDPKSLLEEMRQRLEDLPVSDSVAPTLAPARFDVNPSAVLPRRAAEVPLAPAPRPTPSPDPFPGIAPEPQQLPPIGEPSAALGGQPFAHAPFEAVPGHGDTPGPEDWGEPSRADPFGVGASAPPTPPPPPPSPLVDRPEPFATEPFGQAPAEQSAIDWNAPGPLGGSEPPAPGPFGGSEPPAAGPFGGSEPPTPGPFGGSEPPAPDPAPAASPPPAAPADPFDPATAEEAEHTEEHAFVGNPFNPVDPPPSSLSVPVEDPVPATEPTPPPTAVPAPPSTAGGPPPLPVDAVDPLTGEPDEEAYSAWLKDWLAFAESYGDTAPDDPSRV